MTEGLPDGWAGTRVGDALQVIRGLAFESSAKRMSPEEGYVACLRTANVQRQVAWDDLWYIPASLVRREEQFLKRYDILMSTANSAELVGKVALVRDLPCTSTLGAFITLLRPRQDIDPRFAYYQLSSTTFQQELRRRASTTTNISNISGGKLVELAFRAAPLLEQRRIVDEIEKQFTRLDAALFWRATERVGLQANFENLLGAKYYPEAHSNNNITPGSPFAMRFALTANF